MAYRRKFGSDLNQWVDEECRRDMSCINIDCLIFDDQLKKVLIIESKHENEEISYRQRQALNILREHTRQNNWTIEYYIIRGEYPYTKGAAIHNMQIGDWKRVTQRELKDFLELKRHY